MTNEKWVELTTPTLSEKFNQIDFREPTSYYTTDVEVRKAFISLSQLDKKFDLQSRVFVNGKKEKLYIIRSAVKLADWIEELGRHDINITSDVDGRLYFGTNNKSDIFW